MVEDVHTTLGMIENFVTGRIASMYMTGKEAQYLAAHIRYGNLFKGANRDSITCILKKK